MAKVSLKNLRVYSKLATATAAEEQTATTSEITNNILQMTQVVHDTSRGAHKSANAANGLYYRAEELVAIVKQFKV